MKTFYVYIPSFPMFNCMLILILSLLLIIQPIELKFCVHLKQMQPYLDILSLSLQSNRGLGFYDLNFLKNVRNHSAANFKRSS